MHHVSVIGSRVLVVTGLTERGYDSAAITNAITDAAAARSLGLYVISTDHTAYDRTATKVASWAMHATP